MKNRWKKTAVTLCAVMMLCGCSTDTEKSESASSEQTQEEQTQEEPKDPEEEAREASLDMVEFSAYTNAEGLKPEAGSYISIIGRSEEGAYWEKIKEGAEEAVDDLNSLLGYEGNDKIKITYNAPAATDDIDEQVNILDEELARYPAAVGIAISDTNACEVQFDLAAENGIPVVAFDSGSDYQGLMSTVITENETSATEAANRLAEMMKETGEVILISGDSRLKTHQIRESAFQNEIQTNHAGITISNVYNLDQLEADEESEETEDQAEDETPVEKILKENPNVKGIFAVSPDAVSLALELCSGMDQRPYIVGYDAEEEEVNALQEGDLDGLIVQNPYGMGYATVIAAVRAATGQGNEAVVHTGYTWVTADNLDDESIQNILY